MQVRFGVLGPVVAYDGDGAPIDLKGPRHRAVLARLLVERGRVVPVDRLVDDLWEQPPPGAVSAVRTFVAALRRALEPRRPPRAPALLLVTEGRATRCGPPRTRWTHGGSRTRSPPRPRHPLMRPSIAWTRR